MRRNGSDIADQPHEHFDISPEAEKLWLEMEDLKDLAKEQSAVCQTGEHDCHPEVSDVAVGG